MTQVRPQAKIAQLNLAGQTRLSLVSRQLVKSGGMVGRPVGRPVCSTAAKCVRRMQRLHGFRDESHNKYMSLFYIE
jgi:hypothetical protein